MLKALKKKKNDKGFTLVELVIVVAILAILVGILAPQYTKYVEKSRKASDASNMDEMVRAVQIYAADEENHVTEETGSITMKEDGTTLSGAQVMKAIYAAGLSSSESDSELDTTMKSKNWGGSSTTNEITATITINAYGSVTVTYGPSGSKFPSYMESGEYTANEE